MEVKSTGGSFRERFPAPKWSLMTISSPRASDTPMWPLRVLHAHGAQAYTQGKTPSPYTQN